MEKRLGKATRDAYGETLAALGAEWPDLVVLDADLSKSTKTEIFGKKFPDRFFNVGICESTMVGIAAGLALAGKTVVCSSFSSFLLSKSHDQLRIAVAFSGAPAKFVGSHGGISLGQDGPSQMSIEDVALTTNLPGFTVVVPADEPSTRALVPPFLRLAGPAYMRVGRPKAPLVHRPGERFEVGRAIRLREGRHVALLANGLLVWEALAAAESLAAGGIEAAVWDHHTVKPLDEEAVIEAASAAGAVVVCEEHTVWGGLGSAVATCLGRRRPTPVELVGIADTYAESGAPDELLARYGLTAPAIVAAARRAISRKA